MPDATNNGWSALSGNCDEGLGIAYANQDSPIIVLRFTTGGQIAGRNDNQ